MPYDQPDFSSSVVPNVTEWSGVVSFGSINWGGSVAANTVQQVDFAFPNDGCYYVVDSFFIQTLIIGSMDWSVYYCADYSAPAWICLGCGSNNKCAIFSLYSFASDRFRYPQGIRVYITNNNVYARWVQVNMTAYAYLTGGP